MKPRHIDYPTQKELESIFDVDFAYGKLYWKNGRCKGKLTGTGNKYMYIFYNHKRYAVHHLIWILSGNEIKVDRIIDHKNRNRYDNSILNLEQKTISGNNRNTVNTRLDGIIGLEKKKDCKKPWRIRRFINGENQYNYFSTQEDIIIWYNAQSEDYKNAPVFKPLIKKYAKKEDITTEILKDLFVYDNKNGLLVNKNNRNITNQGPMIGIGNIFVLTHKAIWVFHGNKWPESGQQIDHVDRNDSNNRIENLRLVNATENMLNKANRTKYAGVSWDKTNKIWRATDTENGKRKHYGCYKTEWEAVIKSYKIYVDEMAKEPPLNNKIRLEFFCRDDPNFDINKYKADNGIT